MEIMASNAKFMPHDLSRPTRYLHNNKISKVHPSVFQFTLVKAIKKLINNYT